MVVFQKAKNSKIKKYKKNILFRVCFSIKTLQSCSERNTICSNSKAIRQIFLGYRLTFAYIYFLSRLFTKCNL